MPGAVTGYKVFYGTTSVPATQFGPLLLSTTLAVDVTALTPGQVYYFGVVAVTTVDSSLSNVHSATPYTFSDAPILTSAIPGNDLVTLTWTAPSNTGFTSLTGYQVYYGPTPTPSVQFGGIYGTGTFSVAVTGLTAGITYHFAVVAVNAAGSSPQSNVVSAIPYTAPGAPALNSATAGYTTVNLIWTAPASTGFTPITGYKVFYGTSTPNTQFGDTYSAATLSVAVTGLTSGQTYYFAVKAVNAAGDSVLSNILSATPITTADAPALVSATPGILKATLLWTAPTFTGLTPITGYKVFYGNATPDTQFGSTLGAATLTVDVTGLTAGAPYYFAVKAVNAAGDSVLSNAISATPYDLAGSPLSLSATPGDTLVFLSWLAPTSNGGANITSYRIYRSILSGTEVYLTTVTGMTHYDTGLTNGVIYYYKVSAVNAAGEGPLSSEASAMPSTAAGLAPGLTGAIAGSSLVTITWTAPATPAAPVTGYTVYYGTTAVPATFFGTYGPGSFSAPVTALLPGPLYYFGVVANEGASVSPMSNVMSATPYTMPGAPTMTNAAAGSSQMTITWTAPLSDGFSPLTGYKVFFGTTATPATQFGGLFSTATFSVDVTGLTPGTLYYFAVKAVNAAGDSVLSNVLSATPYTVPNAPTLNAPVAGDSAVTLTWIAPVNNGGSPLTGYKVFFGTTATPATQFGGMLSAGTVTITVTGLTPGQQYYFAVKAVNAAGDSLLSNAPSATPYTVPSAPTLNTATAGINLVHLTWIAPSSNGGSAITGYKVFYGTSSTPSTQFGAVLSAATSAIDVTGLSAGTLYSFGVAAVNLAGDSPLSNVLTALPYDLPGAPTNLAAGPGNALVTLTWNAPASNGAGIAYYSIYRGLTSGTEVPLAVSSFATYSDGAVTNGVTYYYKVSAVNAAGEGPLSSEASATPSATAQNAPQLLSATAGSSLVSLTWAAPSVPLGGAIISYSIYYGT
ncbi:MAG: fibronectin type III domain-containing protein, partial [Methanomassiliicoccales archaeon]